MANVAPSPAPVTPRDDGRPYQAGGLVLGLGRGAPPRKIAGSVATPEKPETRQVPQRIDITRDIYAMRARSRRLAANERTRMCGTRCVRGDGVEVEVRTGAEGPRARWLGVLSCEHRWTCPVCAARIITRRRQQIVDAVERGRALHADRQWRMLTLTIRHTAGMPLARLLAGLRAAWRATRQRGTVQRAWRAHVRASVRAVEITRGPHGWHPHLHVLVLTDVWSERELAALASSWAELVERELGAACAPDRAHGSHWSREVGDAYLAKLGLELTGTAKAGTPWTLVDEASDAYALARALRDPVERDKALARGHAAHAAWSEYEAATRGVRAIELDDRAADLARQGERLRLAAEERASAELAHDGAVWYLDVPSEALSRLRALERIDPWALWRALRIVERARGPDEGGAFLDAYIRGSLPA